VSRRHTIVRERLGDHPAVRAWAAATTNSRAHEPDYVLVLRERVPGAVYALPGVGGTGGAVFAKRSRIAGSAVEQSVYEQILPLLPVPTPRYYGAITTGEYGWIFVEDVGSNRYCQDEPTHRAVAARWLASMHTAAVPIPAVRSLPGAGPARYLRHLHAGRERVLRCLQSFGFTPTETEVLNAVVTRCITLEERWASLEALCRGVPSTLVHCDFQPKNAFLTRGSTGLALWLIDWEMAGYGPPAADLTRIDLETYWSTVRQHWPDVTFETVEHLARAGNVLQWVAALDWESASLECREARDRSDAVLQLKIALERLNTASRTAGLLE